MRRSAPERSDAAFVPPGCTRREPRPNAQPSGSKVPGSTPRPSCLQILWTEFWPSVTSSAIHDPPERRASCLAIRRRTLPAIACGVALRSFPVTLLPLLKRLDNLDMRIRPSVQVTAQLCCPDRRPCVHAPSPYGIRSCTSSTFVLGNELSSSLTARSCRCDALSDGNASAHKAHARANCFTRTSKHSVASAAVTALARRARVTRLFSAAWRTRSASCSATLPHCAAAAFFARSRRTSFRLSFSIRSARYIIQRSCGVPPPSLRAVG
jgi:hypothetical protein